MIDLKISELARIIDGELIKSENYSDESVSTISTDSRTVFKGENSVFFALTGPRNNGHLYLSQLIKKGVGTFVVSDKNVLTNKATFILVKNIPN